MKQWVETKSHEAYTYKEVGGEFATAWQGLVDVVTLRARGVCESGEGDENVLLDQWRRLGWSDEDDWQFGMAYMESRFKPRPTSSFRYGEGFKVY